jgi:hypothetical protein
MRGYRRRRSVAFVALRAKGYLPSDKRQDLHAIQLAVNYLIFWLQQTSLGVTAAPVCGRLKSMLADGIL